MRKRKIIKKANRGDEWRGRLDERTNHLIDTVYEIKESLAKLDGKVEKKFGELTICVDQKFAHHNMHHINVERKYTKLFLVIGTLAVACCLLNPEGLKLILSFVAKFISLF